MVTNMLMTVLDFRFPLKSRDAINIASLFFVATFDSSLLKFIPKISEFLLKKGLLY